MTDKELTDDELEQAAGAVRDARTKESDLQSTEPVGGWPEVTEQEPTVQIKGVSGLSQPKYGGA